MVAHGCAPYRWTPLVIALGFLFCGRESSADDQPQAKLPSAVRKTLKLEAASAKVEDVQKVTSGKSTVWEIDVLQSGKSYELHIAADGTLIHKQLEGDVDVADEEAQAKVPAKLKALKAVAKKTKSPAKSSATRDDDKDEDKKEKAKGKGQSQDEDEDEEDEDEDEDEELSLKELPKAVRNALKREAAGGDIEEIERERENGVTVYEATVEFDADDADDEDEDDGDDEEDEEEEEDEDEDEELVYELKFSKAGVLLSKILVDDEDEEEDDDQ